MVCPVYFRKFEKALLPKPENESHRSGHAVGAPGVGAIFKMYLDLDYVSIVLSNYDPDAMWTIDRKIEDMILRKL